MNVYYHDFSLCRLVEDIRQMEVWRWRQTLHPQRKRTACLSFFPFLLTLQLCTPHHQVLSPKHCLHRSYSHKCFTSSLTFNCRICFEGYGAFMHPLGSVLIQTLCDLLEKEGGPDLEITKLLTRLNYQVAYNFQSRGKKLGGKKQMPCFVTRFTREVFPFMDSRTAAAEDLSLTFAATKLIDEPRRSRKSSIS